MVSFWKSNEIERSYGKPKWSEDFYKFPRVYKYLSQFKMVEESVKREVKKCQLDLLRSVLSNVSFGSVAFLLWMIWNLHLGDEVPFCANNDFFCK